MGLLHHILALIIALNLVSGIQASGQIETLLTQHKITDYDKYNHITASEYHLIINYIQNNQGSCFKQIVVYGKGIGDSFDIPCATSLHQDIYMYVSDSVLMFGDPTVDSFSLFSNSKNNLVVIKDGFCNKRIYTTVERETSHIESEFSDEACHRLGQKISSREYEQERYGSSNTWF